jgi:hypothetical protein
MLERGEFDVCTLVYNRFRSVISQTPTEQRLIPAPIPETAAGGARERRRFGALRVRAGRGGDPHDAPAAEPGHPDLPRAAGERRRLLRQPDERHGQRHAQLRAT